MNPAEDGRVYRVGVVESGDGEVETASCGLAGPRGPPVSGHGGAGDDYGDPSGDDPGFERRRMALGSESGTWSAALDTGPERTPAISYRGLPGPLVTRTWPPLQPYVALSEAGRSTGASPRRGRRPSD